MSNNWSNNMFKKNIILIFTILLISVSVYSANENKYALIELNGAVNPVVADHIVDSISQAANDGCSFVILTIDTPGGLVSSTREIIKAIMNSKIPVITYTYPKGAQAASAGGFIMLSGHLNAMSPGTEIGAMHPVSPMLNFSKDTEKKDTTMEEKVLNDITAFGKSIAEKRKKNVKWTENAIVNKISSTNNEAKKLNVIDYVAENLGDLLTKIDGKVIQINNETFTFKTENITSQKYEMKSTSAFLNKIADPNIIFLLLIAGIAGIWIEVKNPGMIIPGTLGGLSIFMFLLASKIIPINIFGIILLISAVILFILEVYITSFGLLTIGGITCFVLGALILFDSPLEGFSVSYSTIAIGVVMLLLIVFVVLKAVVDIFKTKVSTGRDGLIGEVGVVVNDIENDKGKIYVHGEYWNASSDSQIKKDQKVEIIEVNGMNLKVKKV